MTAHVLSCIHRTIEINVSSAGVRLGTNTHLHNCAWLEKFNMLKCPLKANEQKQNKKQTTTRKKGIKVSTSAGERPC